MRAAISLIAAGLVLAACSSKPVDVPIELPAQPSIPVQVTPITIPCITLEDWSLPDESHLGDVMGPLYKSDPIVHRFVLDWQRMRDEGQACIASQKN